MAKLLVTKLAYFTVAIGLPLWLTELTWGQVLTGFFAVHCLGSLIMALVFQLAHVVERVEQPDLNPRGVVEDEWAAHQLRTTANFSRNNRWLGWFVGGLNFQIEHHLFPGISHIHYPKLSPLVERTAQEFALPYHSYLTLREAISSHRRTLKTLGTPIPPGRHLEPFILK